MDSRRWGGRVTRRAMSIALLLAITATAAPAQRPLPVGARVRVALHERQAQAENRMTHLQFIRGTLESVSGDTLFVRPSPFTGQLAIPFASVEFLQRSRGVPQRLPSAISTGIGGAVTFALNAAIFYSKRRTFGAESRGEAMGNAAKVGGVVFSVVGFIWPVERWRRIRLD